MSLDAHELAMRLGHAAAKEAPYTEDGLAGVISYQLMTEGYSAKAAEALAEEAAHTVFATLTIPTLPAYETEAALFGWASRGSKNGATVEAQPPTAAQTSIGENFALF